MEFVNEIRRAETTNTIEHELVWYEQKMKGILDRLNSMPKNERFIMVGVLLHELLACTGLDSLDRFKLIEYMKK